MSKTALLIRKNLFWIVIVAIIAGFYVYGFYVRNNTGKTFKVTLRGFVASFGVSPDAVPENLWGQFDKAIDNLVKSRSADDFKESALWPLMTAPEKLKIYIAWGTKKTMPVVSVAIILIALILRTRFSATIDVYSAAREAEIRKYQQMDAPVVEVIDSPVEVQAIMNAPAIEVESTIDKSAQMDTF